jgi:hypothetical protein
MPIRHTLLPTLCALFLLSGCGTPPEQTTAPVKNPTASTQQRKQLVEVTGQVLDLQGSPIHGVTVTPVPTGKRPVPLPRMLRYTDTLGRFTWRVPPGTYDFNFQKTGYLGQSKPVNATNGTIRMQVQMARMN